MNLNMPLGLRCVQESRIVVNSQYSDSDLLLLHGWSKQKIKQKFESAMAYTKYRDYRTVTVTGKHGSNYRLSLSCNRKKSKKLNLTNLFSD